MSQSYYDLLGVGPEASTETVEAAYRQRAKETHPDRSDAPDATEQFKAICRARDVLTDPQERARYDRLGHDAYVGNTATTRGPPPGDARERPGRDDGTDTSSGGSRRHRRRQGSRRARAASDTADTRADGFGDAFDGRRAAADSGQPFGRDHAAANRNRSWYRPGADGSDGYRVSTRGERGVRFTSERIGVALLTFALYPVFLASALLPAFPLAVNLLVGLCTFVLVVYLLSVPETGILVFGGWTVLAPLALTASGVGILTGLGVLAWAFCWIPFVLAVANLLFLRA